jgi:serine/threonine kinase 16
MYADVVELSQRGSLQDMIERMAKEKEYMSEPTILRIFIGICEGVACLHHAEPPLAHRDIKPHNILLGDNNKPVLMDFGSVSFARRSIASREDELGMLGELCLH